MGECFGFGAAKDMIACGPWPAPLPLQKPGRVTANCYKKINAHFKRLHKAEGQKCSSPSATKQMSLIDRAKTEKGPKWSQGPVLRKCEMIIKKTEACGCEKPQAVCVCRYSGQIRTQRCPQWRDNRHKTNQLLLGRLPVWPISRPRCESWVMGTEALTCWSLLLLLLLHTQIAPPLALQKVQFSGCGAIHTCRLTMWINIKHCSWINGFEAGLH